MNIFNVTRSAGISYPLFCRGLKPQNEAKHGDLPFSEMTQGKKRMEVSETGVPYELWVSAQSPWRLLLNPGGGNSENAVAEKAVSASGSVEYMPKEDKEDAVNALLTEKTSCTYPIEMEDGELSEITWFTFYEKDRIYCIKEGSDGYEWEIPLEDESQYEKVMAFLESQKDKENMRFASRQIFWQDYLSGELDKEGFQHFLDSRVEKGIPNYVNVEENGTYIDKEAIQFCKYMDQPFVEVIATTEKEFLDWQMAEIAKRKPTLQETDPVEYHYRMFGDRGQRIHYFHGKLYTYEEVFPLEMQEAREAMAKAGNGIDDFYIRNGWTVERFWELFGG